MRRRTAVAAGMLVAGTISAVAATTLRSEPAPFSSVSNAGRPSNTVGFQPQGPGAPRFTASHLLARRGDWEFFRMTTANGSSCWGVSTTYPERDRLANLGDCGPGGRFPSAEQPVLDFSTIEQDERHPRILKLVGFAADGIAHIGLVDADGRVVPAARVVDNVFLAEALPNGDFFRLAALDGDGRVVWKSPPVS